MTRIDPYAAAAAPLTAPPPNCTPRIATLSALGLDAVVHVGGRFYDGSEYLSLTFIAMGSDGRLRSGILQVHDADADSLRAWARVGIPAYPLPDGAESLAEAIAAAVEFTDAAGTDAFVWRTHLPFTIDNWHPGGTEPVDEPASSRLETSGLLSWLEGVPFTAASANAAWERTVGRRVSPEDIEAMSLFGVVACLDPAAFDAARAPGATGRARRAFATTNPLLSNLALGHPEARDLVDAGAPLREVLAAIPGDGPLRYGTRGTESASRRGLSNLSGTPLPPRDHHRNETVVKAADALPREWVPRSQAETEAFTRVSLAAEAALGRAPRGPDGVEWWKHALAGAAGRWINYESRILDAASPPTEREFQSLAYLIEAQAQARGHFMTDVVIPVALAHQAGHVLSLACLPSNVRVGGYYASSRAVEFVHHALTAGMALPAIGDMGRRHADALRAIKAVVDAAPAPGPAPRTRAELHGWFDLCEMPDGRRIAALNCEAGFLPRQAYATDKLVFEGDSPFRAWSVVYIDDARNGSRPPPPDETMAAVMQRWESPQALFDAMTDGKGLPALGLHPIQHGRHTPYDATRPDMLDAMLAAWRPVMPRRWRPLDAAGLAAALDDEAMAFASR